MMEQKVFVICPDKLVNYLVTVLIVNTHAHTRTHKPVSCGLVCFFFSFFFLSNISSVFCVMGVLT